MSIQLKGTGSISAAGVKMLVYGQAGAGKTTLIKTLPHPVILSAEGGLLSLQDADLPYIEIRNVNDLEEAYKWVVSDAANGFESVALDSISEIAEVILSSEKKNNKDPRAAYGAMQDKMSEIIRAFRDITNKHVYFTAKCEKAQDETGKILYSPSMPGNKTGQALPYFFDLAFWAWQFGIN
jgi:phage nucleotide-binding protein